jgi:hypothetical protein
MRQSRMKYIIRLVLIGITTVLISSLMVSCDLIGVSIEKRIQYFIDDLNTDRSNAITNFHQTETFDYGSIATNTGYWDIDFPTGTPLYTIASINDTDTRNVLVTIDGPTTFPAFGRGGTGTDNFGFVMIPDGTNWLIEELWYRSPDEVSPIVD